MGAMNPLPPSVEQAIADGNWLAHRYEPEFDAIHFRYVDREAHRRVTFLTETEIGNAASLVLRRDECLAAARELALLTPRFVIHSAYCCSTMLARALDLPGAATAFKEPQILNDVIGIKVRGADARQVAAALDIALLLLARPLASGEIPVIKPSNLVNPLLPAVCAMRPDARLLLLHAPLDAFLGSVARKGVEGRAWVRELMWTMMLLGQAERFGFTEEELYRHTDLQVAALGWLAQHALFADAASLAPDAVRTLDSETLINRPVEAMAALAAHFDIALDAAAVAGGPAFTRHSKHGTMYDAADRRTEYERGIELHREEVEMVARWARSVADHAGISLVLPSPLLG